jgi:hypothetical protein
LAAQASTGTATEVEQPPPVRHGRSAYVTGTCRCDTCTGANTDYQRERWRTLHRPDSVVEGTTVDASPTQFRIRRMIDDGVTLTQISNRADVARSTLADLVSGRTRRTRQGVHDRVVNAYRAHVARRVHRRDRSDP